jgi:hypothetical protein
MSNVIYLKDWLIRHADVRDCEKVLDFSDEQLESAIAECDDVLEAADVLFSIANRSGWNLK